MVHFQHTAIAGATVVGAIGLDDGALFAIASLAIALGGERSEG